MMRVWSWLCLALILCCATTVQAYEPNERARGGRRASPRYGGADLRIQGIRPEVHLSVGGHGDLGAGFRIDIPVVPEGFLRNGRDEFALSPGIDVQFYDFGRGDCWYGPGSKPRPGPGGDCDRRRHGDGVLIIPQLAAQWNFFFPKHAWSIFPEAGLALVIGDWDGNDNVHVDPLIAFGARKHFADRLALVLRVGWPSGFQVGLAF